jgi:glycosyltransferase involved in cell wall biosynthesis
MFWSRKRSATGKRILVLPPHDVWSAWTGRPPSDDEDRERPYRLLAQSGFTTRRMDIHGFPLNPAARSHPALRAIDPLRALHVLLFERQASLVLCFFESSALVILLLRRLLRFPAKIAVVDLGALDGWRLRRLILDIVVPRADVLLPLSADQATRFRSIWPNAASIQPVYAQTDCDFFAAAPDHPQAYILAIGDDKSRDYATLLAAAASLTCPIAIRTRLIAPDADLPRNVMILSQPTPMPAYRDLIAGASIVVLPLHPSHYAGGVTSLVQAMASGKAVVVSASPGIMEYVVDEETALIVPCHDEAALHQAIARLLSDTALRLRLGAAARKRAVDLFSLEAWAATIELLALASSTPL